MESKSQRPVGPSFPQGSQGSASAVYDDLADRYHLMFDDWWTHACATAGAIERLLRSRRPQAGERLLDFTCGIGTQALPLARLGYQVTGTDISPASIRRAKAEAARRGIEAAFVCREAKAPWAGSRFDFAISADNSLAHFSKSDLAAALASVRSCLKPGAAFLASIRDYDSLRLSRPRATPVRDLLGADPPRITGQLWSWSECGGQLSVELFILERQDEWTTHVYPFILAAHGRRDVGDALKEAGFGNVLWHEPADTGFYQPIITALAA